jgi:long-chain acyl-CoA synthetase
MVVPGYWNRPDATEQTLPGGELRTGDVGFMDPDGRFYLVDRKKDMIVASGYKVWPREVEDTLLRHPAVREAAVIGVPDEYRGETVWAYVSLRPGAQATPDELVGFCREQLAAYKYPRRVEVLPDLPKTPTGKLLRRELRERPRQLRLDRRPGRWQSPTGLLRISRTTVTDRRPKLWAARSSSSLPSALHA